MTASELSIVRRAGTDPVLWIRPHRSIRRREIDVNRPNSGGYDPRWIDETAETPIFVPR